MSVVRCVSVLRRQTSLSLNRVLTGWSEKVFQLPVTSHDTGEDGYRKCSRNCQDCSRAASGGVKDKETQKKYKTPQGRLDHPEEKTTDALEKFPDDVNPVTKEKGGPRGPEPTRYGDWERKGRCVDF